MKRILLVVLLMAFQQSYSQETIENNNDFTIIFDSGLLLGHSSAYYPAPFSANISFLKNVNNRLWIGGGSGAAVIGKTFIPVYGDIRLIPFSNKPFFIYEKAGFTICTNKSYEETTTGYNYYYNNYPHPLDENINTTGGIMNEAGLGILLSQKNWKTSFSIGYRFMKTKDTINDTPSTTYLNSFNRLAVRIGFWF